MAVFNEISGGHANERYFGITTGLVKDNFDKDHPGMIKVEYFLGETGKNVTGWIPVMSPYASTDAGVYFLPEVGAEVVIAFRMGNRNRPIVIGSLWNNKNKRPDNTAVEKNNVKRIRTKAGHDIIFQEEKNKEYIEVHTPKEMKIRIDDEKDTLLIADKESKSGIEMKMKDGHVRIFAEKKITLEVANNPKVTIDGTSVTIKTDDIKAEGTKSVELKAQTLTASGTQTTVEGKSTLDVKSSGITKVAGSMVKVN